MTNEELAVKMEELRQQGETTRQTARLTFWGSVLTSLFGLMTAVCGIATPIILRNYHIETVEKVDSAKEEAKEASAHAERAVQVARTEGAKIDEKVDAGLKQWEAFNSKEPDDMLRAAEAIAKVRDAAPSKFDSKPQ